MNRVFKRLTQGGILNTSDKIVKFTFEGKTYSALEGDSIKMALLVNNITHYHRSIAGHFLSSATGLYPLIANINDNHLKHYTVATDDFKVTHGLKLSQTNKPNFYSKLRSFVRFFKTSTGIHAPVVPLKAKDITNSLVDSKMISNQSVIAFTEKMSFDTEKSYIHTDIAVIGTNIFALQAALILADSGLRVVICNQYADIAYSKFINSELQSLFNDLKTRTQNHHNITLKDMTDISLLCDSAAKVAKIMGIHHKYAYDVTATYAKKQKNSVELSVINAKHILYAPCLNEMGFLFQGHHLPNIMGCREFIDLHLKFGLVAQSHNIVLYTSNDMAYDILSSAGISHDQISAIIDTRPTMTQAMIDAEKRGFKIYAGYVVTHATGKDCIQSVTFKSLRGDKDAVIKSLSCSILLCSAGYGLDISLLNNLPQAVTVNVRDDYKISVCANKDFVNQYNISLCGYALYHADTLVDNKQSVFAVCTQILQNWGIQTQLSENPQIANILSELTWDYPEFYDAHDLSRKEAVLFPQGIHYTDFMQILYRHDTPMVAIEALEQHHNFYGNHRAICILMMQMQKIYNLSPADIQKFYLEILNTLAKQNTLISPLRITDTILTCGQPRPHIQPCADKEKRDIHNQIITPDSKMSAVDIEKYYHAIKGTAGIRGFNNVNIVDISGADSFAFIQKILGQNNKNVILPQLNMGEHFIVDKKQQLQNPTFILHYAPYRYCLIFSDTFADTQICDTFLGANHTDMEVVVNNINQSWAYLQVIGNESLRIFEKIIKQPIPQGACELWIENIQLRFVVHKRFNVPHIEMLITSDAAESFYQKFTQDIFQILPFGDTIYNMFALEAGAIFDMPDLCSVSTQDTQTTRNFTTPALAMPLIKLDKPLVGGDIYPDKNHVNVSPLGVTFPVMIYSPFYQQYVFPTLLKEDFQEWENKIVCVVNKDGQETVQVKIVSDKMSKIQEVA